jgi:CRISPR-associated endonuclease/helicase Cas3
MDPMQMIQEDSFASFFGRATGLPPYPYQERLAAEPLTSRLIRIPTGLGKTAAVILAWLWKRKTDPDRTPRRLVYCLPMRVLVEQTRDKAKEWVAKLGLGTQTEVYTLMGGEVEETWEISPERPAILVGTQDMLLSRALNRGYAMSRYRWPVHFGLLNNDCLWVCDEVQLMGDGLATSAQLAAFRRRFGTFGDCPTIWMSATVGSEMLRSADLRDAPATGGLLPEDLAHEAVARRLTAPKHVEKAPGGAATARGLAQFLAQLLRPGSQTIAVVNTVPRAREVFDEIRRLLDGDAPCHILHSRFRPAEKRRWAELLESQVPRQGRILIATPVIEAGVDISSSALVTDLAPWPNLVQRFGRCNRAREFRAADVFWIDQRPQAAPYEPEELDRAAEIISGLSSASPGDLPNYAPSYEPVHVLRRQDLVDLFDTTPDLSGYDLDVSRFIRSEQDRDVLLAWRSGEPGARDDAPARDELCSAPIHEVKAFLKKKRAWTWNALAGEWVRVSEDELRPGMVLILLARDGGYDVTRGLDLKSAGPVPPAPLTAAREEGNDDDPRTFLRYAQTLAAHSREVQAAMQDLLEALGPSEYGQELLMAALHHDWGKAHPVFQSTVNPDGRADLLAKCETQGKHARKRFRHELAGALGLLQTGAPSLAAYLVAAHHGKVRLSIRALPDEDRPNAAGVKFARGIHDGDALPEVRLGDQVKPALKIDLEPMLLGESPAGEPSWMERMLTLRDQIGVFRLAYLEALMVAADWRASAAPKEVLSWRTE